MKIKNIFLDNVEITIHYSSNDSNIQEFFNPDYEEPFDECLIYIKNNIVTRDYYSKNEEKILTEFRIIIEENQDFYNNFEIDYNLLHTTIYPYSNESIFTINTKAKNKTELN